MCIRDRTSWSFGDEEDDLGKYAWYNGNAENKVHAVSVKRANPWGLYDMHGNVWEWVWDAYDSYQLGKTVNSVGTNRALRGGSFDDSPGLLRSADRDWYSPEYLLRNVGFRCARGFGPQR